MCEERAGPLLPPVSNTVSGGPHITAGYRLQATKYVSVSQWTTDSVDGWNLDNVDCANDCNTAGKCTDMYRYI